MSAPSPRVQHGAVLAGVKAKPSGWPPASPDPSSRRTPTGSDRGAGIHKFRSPRFQGIAGSSLGVAGLIAADRFGISATELAMFTVLQLLVYAGLQVPGGVLLDRFGSRAMLLVGLALMTVGQLAFAFAESFQSRWLPGLSWEPATR